MACKCYDCDVDKPIRVYFCPKCKSRDVKYIFEIGNLFGIMPKMRCGKCGNEMPTFPVLVTTKKLLAESVKIKKGKSSRSKKKKKSGGKKR